MSNDVQRCRKCDSPLSTDFVTAFSARGNDYRVQKVCTNPHCTTHQTPGYNHDAPSD